MKNWRLWLGVGILIAGVVWTGAGRSLAAEITENGGEPERSVNLTTAAPTPCPPELAGTETRLLPANYDVWACEWAPDGKTMVFAGKLQGELSTKMRIWIWPLDPAVNPTQFTNTESLIDFAPRWSPDGKQLVMMRVTYGRPSSLSGLWLKEISSGEGRQLTSDNQDRDPFWSPDGKKIVFCRGDGPYQSQLMLVNMGDGSMATLHAAPQELLYSPWWGRDGKIYFTKLTPGPKEVTVAEQSYQVMDFGKAGIWALDPQTGNLEPVVVDEYDNRLPALSPDGTKLAFVSDRITGKEGNGKFDRGSLYIKDLSTGEIRFITNKVGLNGGSLSWSPDGKKLAFFTFRSIRPAIWVINLNPN
jgi:Tol biopolymer transport system component